MAATALYQTLMRLEGEGVSTSNKSVNDIVMTGLREDREGGRIEVDEIFGDPLDNCFAPGKKGGFRAHVDSLFGGDPLHLEGHYEHSPSLTKRHQKTGCFPSPRVRVSTLTISGGKLPPIEVNDISINFDTLSMAEIPWWLALAVPQKG